MESCRQIWELVGRQGVDGIVGEGGWEDEVGIQTRVTEWMALPVAAIQKAWGQMRSVLAMTR